MERHELLDSIESAMISLMAAPSQPRRWLVYEHFDADGWDFIITALPWILIDGSDYWPRHRWFVPSASSGQLARQEARQFLELVLDDLRSKAASNELLPDSVMDLPQAT